MQCPACQKEARIPEVALYNADAYSKACTIRADCCGAAIRVTPIRSYRLDSTNGVSGDDWGNKVKAA